MTEAGCWAHVRRKIHDVYISTKSATAEEALKLIGELYAIEHEISGLPVSERLAVRQMQSKPLLTSLYKLMQEKEHTLSKKCRLRDAFRYIRKHWVALCNFCDDGLAEADNNTAERALRAVCLGKKNSYDLCQILSPKTLLSSVSFVISRIKEPETVRLYLGFYKLLFGDFSTMTIYAVSWPLSPCRSWRILASLNSFTKITHSVSDCFRV